MQALQGSQSQVFSATRASLRAASFSSPAPGGQSNTAQVFMFGRTGQANFYGLPVAVMFTRCKKA